MTTAESYEKFAGFCLLVVFGFLSGYFSKHLLQSKCRITRDSIEINAKTSSPKEMVERKRTKVIEKEEDSSEQIDVVE